MLGGLGGGGASLFLPIDFGCGAVGNGLRLLVVVASLRFTQWVWGEERREKAGI